MSAVRTALPFPTRPWEDAKRQFLEQLTPEEKQCFETATLENIFYQASAAQKRHAEGSKSWAMQERVSSLVDGIEDYGQALDVYANAFPLVLSPLWGSIRVVLKIAGEAGRFQEKIVDMLASIGDALPIFRIYEVLFRNHERLLKAISTAYLDVVKFCVKAKQFFDNVKRIPLPMSIACRGLWKPFREEFDKYMVDFRKHRKRVEKEAGLAHMIESARSREIELANQAMQKRNDMVNKRHRLLSSLQTVDYHAKHAAVSKLRFQGTNTWLRTSTAYVAWLSSTTSTCLCCYGIPGSGKSVLASSVIDALKQMSEPSTILCYHYFDYADIRSLDMSYIIGSLIRQILTNLPLTDFDEDSGIRIEDYASSSLEEKINAYINVLRKFTQAFVVLDGLDELAHNGQLSILALIKQLMQVPHTVVRVYSSCREGEHLVRDALKSHSSFQLSSTNVSSDISLFVEGALASAVNQNPRLCDPELQKEIRDALLDGANGMFLWVKFQMYDICEALSTEAHRTTIKNLPKDLRETYARIIRRIYDSPGGAIKLDTMRKVLRWVSCARRPLRIEELEEAVGLLKEDKFWPADRIATGAGEKQLINACGHLVVYDRDEHTISLAHPTVRQFLCSRTSEDSLLSLVNPDMKDADRDIGEICIAYLSFSDFETQLVKLAGPPVVGREQAERIIWNQVPLASYIKDILVWGGLAEAPSRTAPRAKGITYELPVPPAPAPVPNLTKKFSLLSYVIEFWAFHTSDFTPTVSCWESFEQLTFHRNLLFQFRPWETETPTYNIPFAEDPDKPFVRLYAWALKYGIRSFLGLLLLNPDTFSRLLNYLSRRARYQKIPKGDLVADFQTFVNIVFDANAACSCWIDGGTFWTSSNIYLLARRCPAELRSIRFLKFLKTELEVIGGPAASDLCTKVFDGAMALAVSKSDISTWKTLCNANISSFEQLSRAFIVLAGRNCGFIDTVFPWHDLAPLFAINIGEDWPQSINLTLLETLDEYLPAIKKDITVKLQTKPEAISQQCVWLLLVLTFASISESTWPFDGLWDLLKVLLRNMNTVSLNCRFRYSTPKSVSQKSHKFTSLRGRTPLAMLFSCLREDYPFVPRVELEGIFLSLVRFDTLPIEYIEEQGLHPLSWAAERDMTTVVQLLMPYYNHFTWRNQGTLSTESGILSLSSAIEHSESSLREMLRLNWPSSIIQAVMGHPGIQRLDKSTKERLQRLALTSQPHVDPFPIKHADL